MVWPFMIHFYMKALYKYKQNKTTQKNQNNQAEKRRSPIVQSNLPIGNFSCKKNIQLAQNFTNKTDLKFI